MAGTKNPPSTPTGLKVICPGMSRTGTTSLQTALIQLGYTNVWHGGDFEKGRNAHIWDGLANQKYVHGQKITRQDLDLTMSPYDAATDLPVWAFYEGFMDAYPEAKIILVERDIEPWYTSFTTATYAFTFSPLARITCDFAELVLGKMHFRICRRLFLAYFEASSHAELCTNARRIYRQHYANVRKAARERGREVLEYRIGQGWEPLCKFLGKEVPEGVEFPRTNESANLQAELKLFHYSLIRQAVVVVLKWTAPIVVAGVAGLLYSRRQM